MVIPLLRFIGLNDHCIVSVENLSSLSVTQIRQLESFAAARRSTLDFTNASMTLWKRIDFTHFNRILEAAGIVADTIESEMVTSQRNVSEKPPETSVKIGFGKYKGVSYKDIPDNYLLWLKRNYRGPERLDIDRELMRRSL